MGYGYTYTQWMRCFGVLINGHFLGLHCDMLRGIGEVSLESTVNTRLFDSQFGL